MEVYDAPLPWTGEIAAPLTLFRGQVRREWLDEFDHVNVAHYTTIADHANWAFWNWINAPEGAPADRGGQEYVIVESHVHYLGELTLGQSLHVTTRLLGHDAKRFVLLHEIWHEDGACAASVEVKCLAFDLQARRAGAWRAVVADRLAQVRVAHAGLPPAERAGRGIRTPG